MKRLLLPALAAAALLTACGSSGHKVPTTEGVAVSPVAHLVPPSPTSLRHSAASNRAFARRDAQKLLRMIAVPPGARQVPAVPKSAPAWFRGGQNGGPPGEAVAHRIWVVDRPLKEVVSYIRSHIRDPRLAASPAGTVRRIGSRPSDDYPFPPVPGRVWSRWLNVSMLALPSGTTVVTARATEISIHPPPRSAVIPGTVKRIDITGRMGSQRPDVVIHVRNRFTVASIVAQMNGLGVMQGSVFCPDMLVIGPFVNLVFRSGDGHVIARAHEYDQGGSGMAGWCNPLYLTVGDKTAPPLIGNAIHNIERLLKADFNPPQPRDVARCLRYLGWTAKAHRPTFTATKDGQRLAIKFHSTGKITTTGPSHHPAVARCLRPRSFFYGYR